MDIPFPEWHGQTRLTYSHPAFADHEPEMWIQRAFHQDYEENSSSMYRMAETSVRGFEHLSALRDRDACLDARLKQYEEQARQWCLILPAVAHNAVNAKERQRSQELHQRSERLFGRRAWERLAGVGTIALAGLWKLRLKLVGDTVQPRIIVTRYDRSASVSELAIPSTESTLEVSGSAALPPATAAFLRLKGDCRGLPVMAAVSRTARDD